MHLPSTSSQSQPVIADTTYQKDLSPKKKHLHTDASLQGEGKSFHHRKTTTLEKPEGYFTVGEQYKIYLMKDYLHGNTHHFSDDDWLYLIIKMGKRVINSKKLEIFQKEFSTTKKEILFDKLSQLQTLRYKIEDIVHHSHFDRRRDLFKAAKEDKHLFPAGSLEEVVELAKNNVTLPPCAAPELLYATASLHKKSQNPFFSDLIIACYRNSHFLPPELKTGQKIEDEIKKQKPIEGTSQDNQAIESMLLDKTIAKKVCGGRTIQLTFPDERTLYIKFQRKDEPWDEFTRELKIHNTLHDLFSDQHFASEIPLSKCLFSLPLSKGLSLIPLFKNLYSIPANEIISSLEDELEISEDRLHGYCFTASSDYVGYACQLDPSNPQNPHSRSEEGLKKAAIDLGKYARYGLTFDSLIKSQHAKCVYNQMEGLAKWMTLGQLSSILCKNADCFPGSIANWVEDTERSDLSWSGLRDLGDSQIFGTLLRSLDAKNVLNVKFFPKVGNLLAYFNALMDNFIAIAAVYARGKRLNPEFHYQNPIAIEEVSKFIGDSLEHFIRGYYSSNTITLQQALELNDTDFKRWLNKTSLEIVYWSAMQPYEMTDAFHNSRHDHRNLNVCEQLVQNKRLDPNLINCPKEYGAYLLFENCHGYNHNLGLGHHNGFPFQALIKGLCKLSINMLEQASPTDQNPHSVIEHKHGDGHG